MPLLYALPITLALVGTIAVTLLVVEVIVPALTVQDPHHPHHRQDCARRGRRRKVLVGASSRQEEVQKVGSISTGVAATRSGDYGYEIRKRRPAAANRRQQQNHREEEAELHVLGEVTASEYELAATVDDDDEDQSKKLATVLSPSPGLSPARSSSTTQTRAETEDQRPLLHFDEEEEDPAARGGGGGGGGSAASFVEPSSLLEENVRPADFERGQMVPKSEAVSSLPVGLVSLGPPAAANREQSSSFSTDPSPAYGAEDTRSSPPRPPTLVFSSTQGAAAATTTRSTIPSSDSNCATSAAHGAAAAPAAAGTSPLAASASLMVDPENGSETGFSSPELVFMSRDASQAGSVAGSGGEEGALRAETSEDDASSWTRVSSPCGFTSLSSDNDDDDVGDMLAQAAQL